MSSSMDPRAGGDAVDGGRDPDAIFQLLNPHRRKASFLQIVAMPSLGKGPSNRTKRGPVHGVQAYGIL